MFKMLSNPTQVIIFDTSGFIIESSDTLFNAANMGDVPVYSYFPLLESIFPLVFNLRDISHFPRVEMNTSILSGVYDFYLKTIRQGDMVLAELTIEDRTSEYDDQRNEQQERQERIIRQQLKGY